jgi:hypothetical protein
MVKQRPGTTPQHAFQQCLDLGAARRILLAVAAAILAAAPGCGLHQQQNATSGPSGLSQVVNPIQLQSELRLQLDNHLAEVTGTATEIAATVQDRRVRENCLRWKMRTYDIYLNILSEPDPRIAFIHEWTNTVALRQYLTTREGKELFGEQQPQAVALAKKMEEDVVALGRKYFPPAAIDNAKDDIEEVAIHYTYKVPFGAQAPPVIEPKQDMQTLLGLPLLPVRVLEGASSTPKAIGEFTQTTKDFAAVVQHLPEMTRWQAELLLLETETSGPMAALAREMDHLEKMLGETHNDLGGLVDAIFWRLMAAIATIFLLALAYHWIARKRRPKQES